MANERKPASRGRSGPPRSDRPRSGKPRSPRPPRDSDRRKPRPPREDRSAGTYVPATSGRGSALGPPVAEDAVIAELDPTVRRELSSLPGTLAEKVAGHLVMAGRLLDDDPDLALSHARTAHDLAPRVPAVREALAVTAYAAGDFRTAMREARTVRRMSGDESWLPIIADCERGLDRPGRAIDLLQAADRSGLPDDLQAECLMVLAGARRDLGQDEAAVAVLDDPLLRSRTKSVWSARLRLAYADALEAVGREDEAERWLRLAVASDPDGTSGAAAELARRQGVDEVDLVDVLDIDDLGEPPADGPAPSAPETP